MKLRYLALLLVPLLLFAACAKQANVNSFDGKEISDITYFKMAYEADGSWRGNSEKVVVTKYSAIKKIVDTLNSIIAGKEEQTYNPPPPSFIPRMTIHCPDGTWFEVEYTVSGGILIDGKRNYPCTSEEFDRLEKALGVVHPAIPSPTT